MLFDRRKFLCGATASVLAVPTFLRAIEAEAAGTSRLLVLVQLDGGNDAFNMVIPLQTYGTYQGKRSNIAVDQTSIQNAGTSFDSNPSTAASAATTYAFHPRMTALRTLYGAGNLAVIMGVGLPANAASRTGHEQAKFAWDVAGINNFGQTNLGWVGQTMDQLKLPAASLPPLASLDGSKPLLMNGKTTQPIVVGGSLGNFSVNTGAGGTDGTSRLGALTAGDAYPTPYGAAEFTRSLGSTTTGYVNAVQAIATAEPLTDYVTTYTPTPNGTKSTSYLKGQFQQVARLMLGGSATRAFHVRQGGYDTHANQNSGQPMLLNELSEAISEFITYLQAKNATVASNVLVMTYSDFGRRVQSNSSAGTDHGTATIGLIAGGGVKGGVYGSYPDFSKLDNDGNPFVGIDFRNQISDIVTALGADPAAVVGQTYPKIGFI